MEIEDNDKQIDQIFSSLTPSNVQHLLEIYSQIDYSN